MTNLEAKQEAIKKAYGENYIHNIGSKETPSPLGKGRNCPRFLLLLIIILMYFLILEKSCIFAI